VWLTLAPPLLVEGDTEGKEFPKNHSVDATVTVSPLGPPFMELPVNCWHVLLASKL